VGAPAPAARYPPGKRGIEPRGDRGRQRDRGGPTHAEITAAFRRACVHLHRRGTLRRRRVETARRQGASHFRAGRVDCRQFRGAGQEQRRRTGTRGRERFHTRGPDARVGSPTPRPDPHGRGTGPFLGPGGLRRFGRFRLLRTGAHPFEGVGFGKGWRQRPGLCRRTRGCMALHRQGEARMVRRFPGGPRRCRRNRPPQGRLIPRQAAHPVAAAMDGQCATAPRAPKKPGWRWSVLTGGLASSSDPPGAPDPQGAPAANMPTGFGLRRVRAQTRPGRTTGVAAGKGACAALQE